MASRVASLPSLSSLPSRLRLLSTSTSAADPLLGSLRAFDPTKPLRNFSPGPTSIPRPVMRQIAAELSSWQGSGLSSMELSHRSPEFLEIKDECEASLRRLVFAGNNKGISDKFEVLFCHGGGHAQFAAVPLNLCATPGAQKKARSAHYYVTGTWSKRAAAEATKFCNVDEMGSQKGWWQPPIQ